MRKTDEKRIREEFENKKFQCPTCPLPHSLSSREVDYLIQKLEDQEKEILDIILELKISDPCTDHNTYGQGYDRGYNDALNQIINSLKKE